MVLKSRNYGNSIALQPGSVHDFAIVLRTHSRSVASMAILRLFTQHPLSVGETYLQHLCTASSFGIRMLLGGLACFVHALLPFLFVRTASRCINGLHQRMVVNRSVAQRTPVTGESGGR